MISTARAIRLLGFLVVFVAAVALSAPAVADDGEVEGAFTMNGQTAKLAYGYVTMDDGDYVIYLTDVPVEYRKLDRLWTQPDVNYVHLEFGPDGSNFRQDLKHVARSSIISGGGTQKIEFETFGPEVFAGRVYLQEPVEFFDSTYQYDVTFKLRLPSLEDLGGSLLPVGGGEPGEAYLAWNAALAKGDLDAIKKLLPPEAAAELESEEAEEDLEFMLLMMPTEVTVTGGTLFGDEAELGIEGVMDGARGHGTITMVKQGDFWVETRTKWYGGPIELDEIEPAEGDEGARRYTTDLIGDLGLAISAHLLYEDADYPGTTEGWVEISAIADVLSPRMGEVPATDAWGHAILYRCEDPSRSCEILSRGPDGEVSEGPDSDDVVWRGGAFVSGAQFSGGDELYNKLKQEDTARAIAKAANMIEAYAMEEMAYPESSGGWSAFESIAMTISEHPELSKYPANEYHRIPTQNAWHDSLLYWSDTQSFRLVSIGPDRQMEQDWIEDSEPSNPDCDDIVFGDGVFVFLPDGVEPP